jgi:hypothetical protein
MLINAGKNLDEAQVFATNFSKANPESYITLYNCFGIFVQIEKRLPIHAPSDSIGNSYWLNGNEKKFTTCQIITDQNSTPILS